MFQVYLSLIFVLFISNLKFTKRIKLTKPPTWTNQSKRAKVYANSIFQTCFSRAAAKSVLNQSTVRKLRWKKGVILGSTLSCLLFTAGITWKDDGIPKGNEDVLLPTFNFQVMFVSFQLMYSFRMLDHGFCLQKVFFVITTPALVLEIGRMVLTWNCCVRSNALPLPTVLFSGSGWSSWGHVTSRALPWMWKGDSLQVVVYV